MTRTMILSALAALTLSTAAQAGWSVTNHPTDPDKGMIRNGTISMECGSKRDCKKLAKSLNKAEDEAEERAETASEEADDQ